MKKVVMLIFFSGFFLSFTLSASAKEIEIQTDQDWFPYTYTDNQAAAGMHIDIVREALLIVGYTPVFKPYPWKRCLQNLKAGSVEAVLSASYKDARSLFAYYPPDAAI